MMMSEFIERTGFEPTAAEYAVIEAEYMGTGIDKDQFCKEWKKNGGARRLMRLRARRIEELESEVAKIERQYNETDTWYCRRINQLQGDMKSKLDEAATAYDQQKKELLRVGRLYEDAIAAKEKAEKKLDTVREAFAILGIVKEGQ